VDAALDAMPAEAGPTTTHPEIKAARHPSSRARSTGAIDPILGTPSPMLTRARETPDVTIDVLQDAGHALIVEAPEQMNDLLTGFLH
jgi:pimeloyl-ACP methyl ester carboxylesterase